MTWHNSDVLDLSGPTTVWVCCYEVLFCSVFRVCTGSWLYLYLRLILHLYTVYCENEFVILSLCFSWETFWIIYTIFLQQIMSWTVGISCFMWIGHLWNSIVLEGSFRVAWYHKIGMTIAEFLIIYHRLLWLTWDGITGRSVTFACTVLKQTRGILVAGICLCGDVLNYFSELKW